jgi:ATP-dependent Lon protease
MGTEKSRCIEQQEANAVDWKSVIVADGIFDNIDDVDDESLEIRDGLALLVHPGHIAPPDELITRAKYGLAGHWRTSIGRIRHLLMRSLRTQSHRVYFVEVGRWAELFADNDKSFNDARAITIDLLWRIGEHGYMATLRASPWLATPAPANTPKHRIGGEISPGFSVATGMWDHFVSANPIGGEPGGLAAKLEIRRRTVSRPRESVTANIASIPEETYIISIDALLDETAGNAVDDGDSGNGAASVLGPLSVMVYDVDAVEAAIQRLADSGNREVVERASKVMKKMIELGGVRRLAPAPSIEEIRELGERFPNFYAVTSFIAEAAALAHLPTEHDGAKALQLPGILLLGPPGVGKTEFARAFARTIRSEFHLLPMATLSAGWIISGSSSLWSSGRIGKVASALVHSGTANPTVLLDEIGASGGDPRYDTFGSMYALLEPSSAKSFIDEYLDDIELDASHIYWIATSNSMERIPEPILSRLVTFSIEPPTRDQVRLIASNIYTGLLLPYGSNFSPSLSADVLDSIGTMPPRALRLTLQRALGRAALAKRSELIVTDLKSEDTKSKTRSIGFCPQS